jgi:VWFA-related protein
MSWKLKTTILSAVFILFGILFAGQDVSYMQEAPPPLPTPPDATSDEDDIIKIDTEIVNVLFTAQDKKRRLLTNLKEQDVKIFEDGQAQEVTAFYKQIDLPLSLAILIDTSASQERTLPEEKTAAKSFIEAVIRPAKDEVAVISFTGEATLEQGMTSNIARLQRAVDRVEFVPPSGYLGGGIVANGGVIPGTPPISGRNQMTQGSTAIWDSIWITSEEILGTSPEKTRRAIILLSDGVNTYGIKKLEDAVEAAQRSEAVIYSIGIGDNFYDGVNEGALNKISERTGGRAFFPRDEMELRQAFKLIQEEMRSQYLIAYAPSNQKRDGSYRKIEIQLTNPEIAKQNITLTHRQGYFSKKEEEIKNKK